MNNQILVISFDIMYKKYYQDLTIAKYMLDIKDENFALQLAKDMAVNHVSIHY